MNRVEYKLGELFCGPGGLALGAKWSNVTTNDTSYSITHAWATDYDRDTCNTYRKNICPNKPNSIVHSDIRNLKWNTLGAISDIDALAFGFPCNDFSVVGEQKGIDGVYGPLYEYCISALRYFKPKWFLAENVSGLRNANDGQVFSTILKKLTESGYAVYPHIYRFEDYGVPQARHRIIIVGFRNDLHASFAIPSSTPYRDVDVSSYSALMTPPIPDHAPNQDYTRQSETVINRLRHIKPGENAFTADLPQNLRLNVKGAKISSIYRRLDPNKPAYTITGSGGGGTHVYHWSEDRALTNRERARLQTFPDDFVFCGSKESVRKQIGMAVPPKGAKVIFQAILSSLAHIAYPSIQPNICLSQYSLFKELSI